MSRWTKAIIVIVVLVLVGGGAYWLLCKPGKPTVGGLQIGGGCTADQLKIVVSSQIMDPCTPGGTGAPQRDGAMSFAWNTFIALSWPADPTGREKPTGTFGRGTPVVWETMRNKVELYPGNGSATVAPHGVVLDANGHPTNKADDYGYAQGPQYIYGENIPACTGVTASAPTPWVTLDETTQVGNNQTYAGAGPTQDPGNSRPQLIRYNVKMGRLVYSTVIGGEFWYGKPDSGPHQAVVRTARQNYQTQLATGSSTDPASPFVNLAALAVGGGNGNPATVPIEIKTSWRPLTGDEAKSGHFYVTRVRYYEPAAGNSQCYREGDWGLVGLHILAFPQIAPWVIWATFEQADNIRAKDGTPTENEDGGTPTPPSGAATDPELVAGGTPSDPTVEAKGASCDDPGKRLYFRENPDYKKLPTQQVCVDHRWHAIPADVVALNGQAHAAIRTYLAAHGGGDSPWLHYKLIDAQNAPVDTTGSTLQTAPSYYYLSNSTIETDYTLGNFAGDFDDGRAVLGPANNPNINTNLPMRFQSLGVGFVVGKKSSGGCSGCHGLSAMFGGDFSFALADNIEAPEPVDAFKTDSFRTFVRGQAGPLGLH